jgi:hypothetical protein
MITIEMNDPKFVAIQSFEVTTNRGVILIAESEPCSLVSDSDSNVFLGNGGTVLQIKHNTGLVDILSMLSPATWDLVVEDSGEISLRAALKGPVGPSKTEKRFDDVADIISIRPFGGLTP